MDNEQIKPITVFISYSWDSEEHKAWVKMLADRLYKEGLEVLLDQYERAGTSLSRFMTNGLEKADKVLIVGTPEYKKKAETKGTGAAFEEQIIKIDMMDDLDTTKFIPILRKGSFPASFTKLIRERIGFIFSDDTKFESEFKRLVDELYGKSKRPEKIHEIQWTISLNEGQISGTYFGPLKDGKPEGIGHFIGKDVEYRGDFKYGNICSGKLNRGEREILEGMFINGELNGQGKKTWLLNGIETVGEFKCGNLEGKGKITWPNGDVYTGIFENGKSFVENRIICENGDIYEGEFHNGKLKKGKKAYADGKEENGEFNDEGELDGSGRRVFPDGSFERGTFRNGKLHGKDCQKKRFDEIRLEKGKFWNGILNGKGERIDSEGVIESGMFVGGCLHGLCVRTFPNGRVEEGCFQCGELNGKGRRTYPNGLVEEGDFEDGQLNGQGRRTYPNGRIEEGVFEDGKLHRKGKITYPDGRVEEGEFENGQLHGKGKITYPDGRVEEGVFRGGFLDEGRKIYPNGQVVEGELWGGELHGQGKITYPDGRVEEGEFRYGELIQ